MKYLDEKLIAELIPEVGPRIIFLSYHKKRFTETKLTTNDIQADFSKTSNVSCTFYFYY